jgi:hypothetical protein
MAGTVTKEFIDKRRRQFVSRLAEDIPDGVAGELYRRAVERYGTTCLRNCRPSPTASGLTVIAERLIKPLSTADPVLQGRVRWTEDAFAFLLRT